LVVVGCEIALGGKYRGGCILSTAKLLPCEGS